MDQLPRRRSQPLVVAIKRDKLVAGEALPADAQDVLRHVREIFGSSNREDILIDERS